MAKKPYTYIEIREHETCTEVYLITADGHLAKLLKTVASKEEAERFLVSRNIEHKVYYR